VIAPVLAGSAGAIGAWAAWVALAAAQTGRSRVAAALAPGGSVPRLLAPVRAGRGASRAERRRLALAGAAGLLVTGTLLAGPVGGIVLAACGPLLAARMLAAAGDRRRARLAAAAPLVARAVADALAGGHSIRGAMGAALRGGVSGPAADELREVTTALALGERTEVVLERLRRRADHPAYDAMVAAILLQRESGGDLAALLRRLAGTIEEQVRAELDARSLTAQARFTAVVVAALPAIAAGLAELAHPGYLASLVAQPVTAWLAGLSVVLQVAAWLAVRRFGRVRR
jgi:tight adherence protein B